MALLAERLIKFKQHFKLGSGSSHGIFVRPDTPETDFENGTAMRKPAG